MLYYIPKQINIIFKESSRAFLNDWLPCFWLLGSQLDFGHNYSIVCFLLYLLLMGWLRETSSWSFDDIWLPSLISVVWFWLLMSWSWLIL